MKTDAELLAEFTKTRSEDAFAEVVARHGEMVFGTCLRLLKDRTLAEEASQAVLMVLARKAASVCGMASIGGWLHGVAGRVARKALRSEKRRRARERRAAKMRSNTTSASIERQDREALAGVIDDEIARLNSAQRDVVVGLYLRGLTRSEMSVELGVPEGTIASRSASALERLRGRLARRGVHLGTGALAAGLAALAPAGPLPAVFAAIPAMAAKFAAGGAAALGGSKAGLLAEGAMKMMFWARVKAVAAVALCAAVVAGGSAAGLISVASARQKPGGPAIAETLGGSRGGARNGRLDKKITVKYEKTSLGDALKDIGAKAGVRIAAEASVLSGQPPVRLEATDEAAGRVLTRVLRRRGLKVKSYAASPLQVVRHNWYEPLAEKEEVYEFVRKPTVKNLGKAGFAIDFETKGFCDCTVAIVDAKGKTVRHLASGVLGVNAPKAFAWNSKQLRVVWDGTDDRGRPVAGPVKVRVSLGLKARMERTLFWAPHKRAPTASNLPPPCIAARPEGVYVFDGAFGDHLKLFDRDGKYVRTVFPPPADKVPGIKWPSVHHTSTPERPFPLKWQYDMSRILTLGWPSYGGKHWPNGQPGAEPSNGCSAMAIQGQRVALAQARLNRLSTDGSSGGVALHGPSTYLPVPGGRPIGHFFRRLPQVSTGRRGQGLGCVPSSMAFSPDGKWLYATGYTWMHGANRKNWKLDALPLVTRMAYDGKERMKPWAGSPNPKEFGDGKKQFCHPIAVSVDGKGRVYVCDYMNSRVQVFSPEAELLGSLKTPYPADIKIHPETGECYVFSWGIGNVHWAKQKQKKAVQPNVIRYGAFPKFKKGESWGLSGFATNTARAGQPFNANRVDVDFWSNPPRLWLFSSPGDTRSRTTWRSNIRVFALDAGKPKPVCNFLTEAAKDIALARTCGGGNKGGGGKVFVSTDPLRGHVWVRSVTEAGTVKDFLVRIDPETGKETLVKLPKWCAGFHDMAFDQDGYLYMRTKYHCVRYEVSESGALREKPFKHGRPVKLGRVSYGSVLSPPAIVGANFGAQGLGISPQGHVVFAEGFARGHPALKKTKGVRRGNFFHTHVKEYRLPVFPGRYGDTVVWIYDNDGKLVCDDGFKGAGWMAGTKMDRDGYVYTSMMGRPLFNGKAGSPMVNWVSCTLMKFKPGEPRLFWDRGQPPLATGSKPKRPREFSSDLRSPGAWLEGVEWLVPEVGLSGNKSSPHGQGDHGCICQKESRFDLDLYARSFCSEVPQYRIGVFDSNGNRMSSVGRLGNVDDGLPLAKGDRVPNPRSIGGDEVAIAHCLHVAVDTDKRLFISDIGNACIRSVKLDYHVSETVKVR